MLNDALLPFTLAKSAIRGRIVRLGPAIDQILTSHNYPELVSELLAELSSAACLIGSSLKSNHKVTLQCCGKGAIKLLVCQYSNDGRLRSYSAFDKDKIRLIERQDLPLVPYKELLGSGQLSLSISPLSSSYHYQAIIELKGNSISEILENYFWQSEQLKSKIFLASQKNQSWQAGGVLLQQMPLDSKSSSKDKAAPYDSGQQVAENFREAQILLQTLSNEELFDSKIELERLIFRLFHEQDPQLFSKTMIKASCSCNEDKIIDLLKHFAEQEPSDNKQANKEEQESEISVDCQFCGKTYYIKKEDLS